MHQDKSDNVILVLLDLSAALDTVYHEIVFKCMEKRYVTKHDTGNVLKFL